MTDADQKDFEQKVKTFLESNVYPVDQRLTLTTKYILDSGVTPAVLARHYINEAVGLIIQKHGATATFHLLGQLYWHVAQLLEKITAFTGPSQLNNLTYFGQPQDAKVTETEKQAP